MLQFIFRAHKEHIPCLQIHAFSCGCNICRGSNVGRLMSKADELPVSKKPKVKLGSGYKQTIDHPVANKARQWLYPSVYLSIHYTIALGDPDSVTWLEQVSLSLTMSHPTSVSNPTAQLQKFLSTLGPWGKKRGPAISLPRAAADSRPCGAALCCNRDRAAGGRRRDSSRGRRAQASGREAGGRAGQQARRSTGAQHAGKQQGYLQSGGWQLGGKQRANLL